METRRETKRAELPLTSLRQGESGIITSIRIDQGRGYGRRRQHGRRGRGGGFKKRLMDMGLIPGTRLTVVEAAPFHGPLEVSVRGSRLALGRGLAERVFVEKIN